MERLIIFSRLDFPREVSIYSLNVNNSSGRRRDLNPSNLISTLCFQPKLQIADISRWNNQHSILNFWSLLVFFFDHLRVWFLKWPFLISFHRIDAAWARKVIINFCHLSFFSQESDIWYNSYWICTPTFSLIYKKWILFFFVNPKIAFPTHWSS